MEQINRRTIDANYHSTEGAKPVSMICRWISKDNCHKLSDIVVMLAIIVALWLTMALPTIIYVYKTVSSEANKTTDSTNSKAASIGDNITTCERALYDKNDSICKPYLQSYTNCLKGTESGKFNSGVYVSNPLQQMKAESVIGLLSLQPFLRLQCRLSLEPLICLYFIHLCDNGTEVGPSQEQCEYISDACDEEVKQISLPPISISVDEFLLSCALYTPFNEKHCIIVGNYTSNGIQNCSPGFYLESGRCHPECNVWSPFSHTMVLITDLMNIFAAVLCVLSGCIVLGLSWIRRQKLYAYGYHSIFIIYQTVLAIVLSTIVLVGVSARKRFFCRSRSLIDSVLKPTTFCFITGIALYYIVLQLLLWWLWHTIAVLRSIVRPLHTRKFKRSRNTKYLQLIIIFASLLFPVIPVVIVIFAGTNRGAFTITRAPPILCAGYDLHTNFWAFFFPLNVLLAIGVTLLVIILRIVIKNHYLSKIHEITINLNWALEIKVLIVLCYYVILGVVVLSVFTNALFNVNMSQLIDYFTCEARGIPSHNTECENKLKIIQATDKPILISLAIVVLGLLPLVNLVYVLKFSELRRKIKTYSQTRYVRCIQNEANKSAAADYIPYNEYKDTTLHCDMITPQDNTHNTDPLLTSQINNDLRT